MKTATNSPLGKDAIALAGLFLTSGTLHFVRPQPFESIVPKRLPSRRALVYASGAAEIACAVGLLVPRTRRVAGLTSAALLVAVLPANVTMTGQAKRRLDRDP
ncbi:MAG: DoxX family membrane protein, partial [Dermatophilaceae bacterium]|nr:DoxX family membrane protein [Dermatophilaceae bacterium]